MRQGKVIPLNAKQGASGTGYLLDESRDIALKYLPALLQRMLDNADDILFELADKAENNQEQNTYFDAMRELRLARGGLENGFRERLMSNFDAFLRPRVAAAPATASPEPAADEMRLVDDPDLEESLAITTMTAKIKSRYPRELYAIEQRFQAVAGDENPVRERIPIGPEAICHAFQEPVAALDSDIKIKLIIYKLFDKHVLAHLQSLYDETNVLFISAGVLPKLRMQVNRQPRGDCPSDRHQAPAADIAWLDDSAVSPTQASLDSGAGYREPASPSTLGTLRRLLHLRHGAGDPSLSADNQGDDPAALIAALSNLQQLNLATSAETFRTEIAELRRGGKISVVDNDIIDIVDMLFDFILDDDHLPTITKALLARLQIPMIKVALVDRGFLGAKQHPAKKLLNLMAKASVGLGNDVTRENCPLIEKIDTVVNRICTDFSTDTTIFEELLQAFEQFLVDETECERQTQEVSRQRIQKREQHALSRAWVTDAIAAAINNRRLPKPVFELIDGPWKEVMIDTYLNDGQDSEHWKENLRFIDLLIWSVEPGGGRIERQRLGRIVPELVRTLRGALKNIHYPPARVDALLAELEALHLAGLRGEAGSGHKTVKVKAAPSLDALDADTAEGINRELDSMRQSLSELGDLDDMMEELLSDINPDRADGPPRKQAMAAEFFDGDVEEIIMSSTFVNEKTIPEIDDHYWAMVQQLKPGQWISLMDDKGKQQKIKLSWKSDMLGECTFINWKFKVAADLSFNQLAAKFRAGQAALVESLPLFERAIDAVINSLQRRQAD